MCDEVPAEEQHGIAGASARESPAPHGEREEQATHLRRGPSVPPHDPRLPAGVASLPAGHVPRNDRLLQPLHRRLPQLQAPPRGLVRHRLPGELRGRVAVGDEAADSLAGGLLQLPQGRVHALRRHTALATRRRHHVVHHHRRLAQVPVLRQTPRPPALPGGL